MRVSIQFQCSVKKYLAKSAKIWSGCQKCWKIIQACWVSLTLELTNEKRGSGKRKRMLWLIASLLSLKLWRMVVDLVKNFGQPTACVSAAGWPGQWVARPRGSHKYSILQDMPCPGHSCPSLDIFLPKGRTDSLCGPCGQAAHLFKGKGCFIQILRTEKWPLTITTVSINNRLKLWKTMVKIKKMKKWLPLKNWSLARKWFWPPHPFLCWH